MDDLEPAARSLRALADPTRLRILHLLGRTELSVAELTRVLGIGQSTVSQHLAPLREAGLVVDRRDGTRSYYSRATEPSALAQAFAELAPEVAQSRTAAADRAALADVLRRRAREAQEYFERIAEAIEHEYLPGRTWEGLAKGVLRLLPRQRVADLGIGGGELTLLLCRASALVVGVDSSRAMLERVRAKAEKAGVTNLDLRLGEIERLPIDDEAVDLVILSQALHHAVEPARALREALRVLAPGGRILVLDLVRHKELWTREKFQDRWPGFLERELRAELAGAGFVDVDLSVACRERQPPHFQTLLAVATRPPRAAVARARRARRGTRPILQGKR